MDQERERVEAELIALAARRWRIASVLTAAMMATYFGFIFLVAWAKPVVATLVTSGLSLGILLGALVIVVAWAVTGIYVVWANSRYDGALAVLQEALLKKKADAPLSSDDGAS